MGDFQVSSIEETLFFISQKAAEYARSRTHAQQNTLVAE